MNRTLHCPFTQTLSYEYGFCHSCRFIPNITTKIVRVLVNVLKFEVSLFHLLTENEFNRMVVSNNIITWSRVYTFMLRKSTIKNCTSRCIEEHNIQPTD